jgi:hypothetical protein
MTPPPVWSSAEKALAAMANLFGAAGINADTSFASMAGRLWGSETRFSKPKAD